MSLFFNWFRFLSYLQGCSGKVSAKEKGRCCACSQSDEESGCCSCGQFTVHIVFSIWCSSFFSSQMDQRKSATADAPALADSEPEVGAGEPEEVVWRLVRS